MNLSNLARPISFFLVFLALAACSGGITTTYVSYDAVGVPRLFQYAASAGDVRTVIYGNPSSAPKAAFDASVVDAMQGRGWGADATFATTRPADARDGYRVVMVFSGDRHFGGAAACRGVDAAALAPVAGKIGLQAAFCHADKVLSQAHIAFALLGGVDDPVLGRVVSLALADLFPPRDLSKEPPDTVIPPS